MASNKELTVNKSTISNTNLFSKRMQSSMAFDSAFVSDLLAFEWLEFIENLCPFVDVVIRNPKVQLIKEENIVLTEKSRKTNVESIKDLAKHTERITTYNSQKDELIPSKILDIRNEETYNIYENRLLYSIIILLDRFLYRKEKQLKDLELRDTKLLEYASSTSSKTENIQIKFSIDSQSMPNENINDIALKRIKEIKKRIKAIRFFASSWQKSLMYKALEQDHVKMLEPPLKMTNVLLKNHNFKAAIKLWEYLYKFEFENHEETKEGSCYKESKLIKDYLDHAFLIGYSVMEAMTASKKEQKEQMAEYALIILKDELKVTTNLLKKCGYVKSEEEVLKLIAKDLVIDNKKNSPSINDDEVKKKFKNIMNEYLEKTKEDL